MKLALIVVIVALILSLYGNYLMLRAATKFTNEHNQTVSQLRKARTKAMDVQENNSKLRQSLAEAKAEIDKWKGKALEISINAQKGAER